MTYPKVLLMAVLAAFSCNLYSQCDQDEVFSNDSTHAVCIDYQDNVITIHSNNFPDHSWGNWPSGTPVLAQDFEYFVCAYPVKASEPTSMYDATGVDNCSPFVQFGVGLNGIFYAGWGARWFVNPETMEENFDWNVEPTAAFNMDFNNAHSNNPGEYHYHGIPTSYFEDSLLIDGSGHSPLIGYAADGFPVYYKYVFTDANNPDGGVNAFSSGYTLIPGDRPGDGITEPDGPYDGYYVEDYEYLDSDWELDECNGRFGITPDYPEGTYYYVLTDEWPFMPRCFYGTHIDNSFRIGPNCPGSTASEDCSTVSVNEIKLDEQLTITVFPNPSLDIIHLKFDSNANAQSIDQISIYDLQGHLYFSASEFHSEIDISALPVGVYFLQVSQGKNEFTKKIVIQ